MKIDKLVRAQRWTCALLLACALLVLLPLKAQTTATPAAPTKPGPPASAAKPTHMTPAQAKELFRSVDSILQFDSKVTGLPILHSVKRRLVTREEVEKYLTKQLHNSRDARELERSQLVLKKFGMLDRNFELEPFLVKLLREQIAGYYNDKTKTVNLLDWIPPDEQKPVLAHELTHALQDQHVHLAKWDRAGNLSIAKNVQQDNQHIATDEQDTARDAVVEGQAMAVFIDYALAPTGKNLLSAPGLADRFSHAMSDTSGSPTLASAPLVLRQSLLFPYADGLDFVRAVLAARGRQAAFVGMLDHPPSSTYEIMTPRVYLDGGSVPLLHMPDIHPLIDADYRPYDVGVMGELDVEMMADVFGGAAEGEALAPAWRGGIYYAAQSKTAKTSAEKDALGSLALLYLSRWATPAAAREFADLYARDIPRKYEHAVAQPDSPEPGPGMTGWVWSTPQGPVLIVLSGRTVFISESFPMELARKLELVMMGSVPGTAGSEIARSAPATPRVELTAGLRRWLWEAGMLRAAAKIDAEPASAK